MKMKKKILILALSVICFLLLAQDPEWIWARITGGDENHYVTSICNDFSGNVYITGRFKWNTTIGNSNLITDGDYDIFVAKLDAEGNFLWAQRAGGIAYDTSYDICCDQDGNVYIAGKFEETANFGSYTLSSNGSANLFIAKLESNGNWQWAISAGNSGTTKCYAINSCVDGNIVATGYFTEEPFFGSTELVCESGSNLFVAKLDPSGNWIWASQSDGTSPTHGHCGKSICSNSSGDIFLTGYVSGNGNFGSTYLASNPGIDMFIAKLDINGNWIWAINAGDFYPTNGVNIIANNEGESYTIGNFRGSVNFGNTLLSTSSYNDDDIFISKIDNSGNWMWSRSAGGIYNDYGAGICINENNNINIGGTFRNDASFGPFTFTASGQDLFLAELDAEGNWIYAIQAGGTNYELMANLTIDHSNNLFVAGTFIQNITFGTITLYGFIASQIYIAKYGNDTSIVNELISLNIESISNHPNPFNPSTIIEFSIQNNSKIEISIFNIKGQKIRTLANNEFAVGTHSILWTGDNENNNPVGSGIYYYKLNVNGNTAVVKKCLLLK